MLQKSVIQVDRIPNNLVSNLDARDAALWVQGVPETLPQSALVRFLGLPWRLVLSEGLNTKVLSELQASGSVDEPLIRKRGYVQIIDTDPSRIALPERSLPFYVLGGRQQGSTSSSFADRLRRMTMLDALRQSAPRELLIVSDEEDPIPGDLRDLWSSGFRCYVTIVSTKPSVLAVADEWVRSSEGVAVVTVVQLDLAAAINSLVAEYESTYPEERHVIRVRSLDGNLRKIDITSLDDPERPLLEVYSFIEERDLVTLNPSELGEQDFIGFFRDPSSSWRPYAAGLPWSRYPDISKKLLGHLRRLDDSGSEENCITYISAESGAGGTTLARSLAWDCAHRGYPTLVARPVPFAPAALPVANFLSRVHAAYGPDGQMRDQVDPERLRHDAARRYETPWLIVFDSLHWQYRESDLVRFKNEISKSGRPVCILVVTGATMPMGFINANVSRLAELTHAIEPDEALRLGTHLNQFLKVYGHERTVTQWQYFYSEHSVRYVEGVAAFWVVLSFWIQGQYDLSESIQEWMYRCFKENADDRTIQEAIVQIAALSSERLPMPEALLPTVSGRWPMSQLLSDRRSSLAALGLVRFVRDTAKFWGLVHDILGRLLVNALFYDYELRKQLGFANATTAEHLRFMLLRKISQLSALGERPYIAFGEDFATTIFKIDPDHGHANFVPFWRDVLDALDEMPRPLRDGSRLFRHHCAISRRRIAKLGEAFYGISSEDRVALLKRAIEDIRYALDFIAYSPGAESNLNLYNSLANAYFDLADEEAKAGATQQRLIELRNLGNDATRRAYTENPTNSFVIETYVKNLLHNARIDAEHAVEICIEGLGILFSAMTMNEESYRAAQLGTLADKMLSTLFASAPRGAEDADPRNAVGVLVRAWAALATGVRMSDHTLVDIPEDNRARALDALRHPAGRGNMQVIRLTYDLMCAQDSSAVDKQLELLEQLTATDYRLSAQLKLEYAILLFQNGRPQQGDKVFRELRRLWKESEQAVQVPDRLRWLRGPDANFVKTVNAVIGLDSGIRATARVQEFGGSSVPFRPEEFDMRVVRAGTRFSGHISFGHNGPFLRPLTSGPQTSLRGARA